jgi:hypothetical protein
MKLLLVYYQETSRLRSTVRESLRAFGRSPDAEVHYLNALFGAPAWIARASFDAVLFHYTFLATKWHPPHFRRLQDRCRHLRALAASKGAIAHDEYVHSDAVCAFLRDFGVNTVFTVAPPADAEKIYAAARPTLARTLTVLTAYVDADAAARLAPTLLPARQRTLDVGYRVRPAPYWLGRRALVKQELAERLGPAARRRGLRVDVRCESGEGLLEDQWYRFLAGCRTVLGCEGGSSVHDPDGRVCESVRAYLGRRPQASFDEVEQACFPGKDGTLGLFVLSPRHLEACLTRTCQVLVEGEYSGVLQPGRHYIALAQDFSNLEEVLGQVGDVERCERIADQAHRDVVASGHFGYDGFVRTCAETLCPASGARPGPAVALLGPRLRARERAGQLVIAARDLWLRARRRGVRA